MSFSSTFQPILQDTGLLALGCHRAEIGGSSVGWLSEATFEASGTVKEILCGFPEKVVEVEAESLTTKASITVQELGGAGRSLLQAIASSLATGVVPQRNLALQVFRPRARDILINLNGAALLQEFSFSFGQDFNSFKFSFEQVVGESSLDNQVSFTEAATLEHSAPSSMLEPGNVSIGFPLVGSNFAVQGVNLNLQTEYHRVKKGYPRELRELIPLKHTLTLEVQSEEFSTSALAAGLSLGNPSSISVRVGLFDGTAVIMTIHGAVLLPGGPTSLGQKQFSTLTKKFIATGNTLLSIS